MRDDLNDQYGPGAEDADGFAHFQKDILDEILAERERQINLKHGGDTKAFDKQNTKNDWVAYIVAYAGRASDKVFRNEREGQLFRVNMVKVAAIAMAAIEAFDQDWC